MAAAKTWRNLKVYLTFDRIDVAVLMVLVSAHRFSHAVDATEGLSLVLCR